MSDVIIDTDILIDVSRQVPKAINFLQALEQQSVGGISSVTQMELLIGCRNKTEQRHLETFLRRFQIIKLNEVITDTAVKLLQQYRLSHGLLIADSLIAATALSINKPFVSKNQRDYRFITGLQLLTY